MGKIDVTNLPQHREQAANPDGFASLIVYIIL
ncbi:hypothetical protein SAMN05444414_10664 [Roseovarius marisflavi]|uniref:Uncharacterized protein n=1 Tax=Roseovarius marisflavi TaxID=1054996 RepID=A0A1M6YAY5_9RHOB|nr:hypothetical protein SAMN05444414_10664 [Roseovarius marisflavi]